MKLRSVLILPAAALRTTAAALRLLAGTGQRLADVLSPDGQIPTPRTAPPAAPARRAESPPAAAGEVDPVHLDLPGLAARPAPEVIAALDGLGTTELGDLYEYERKHRRRRSVLDAIAAAAAPPASGADTDEDLSLLADVREPDELVYSTGAAQRPPRG